LDCGVSHLQEQSQSETRTVNFCDQVVSKYA